MHNLCTECGKPLLVRYDLAAAAQTLTKASLSERESSLWRYREVLPVADWNNTVSFGEGWTPLLNANRLAETGVAISRLAHGVPVGGELDYLDDGTLTAAMNARRPA